MYGVDMNPLAVELCKVSLWMESIEPGLPLSFLETHIRHGNSLLGTTQALMADGVPDAAWLALEGDDEKIARSLKNRNRDEREGQQLISFAPSNAGETLNRAVTTLERASDTDLGALATKERQW